MENKQIASLGCKFLGIYSIIQSIPLLGNIFQVIAFAKDDSSLTLSLLFSIIFPFILMSFLGFLLIYFSNQFAQRMVPTETNSNADNIPSSKDLQAIAFSVVGLVLIVLAIPKFFQIGWNVHALLQSGDQRNIQELLRENWSFTLGTGIQLIIGFFLFIGSKLLSLGWHLIIQRLKYEKNIT